MCWHTIELNTLALIAPAPQNLFPLGPEGWEVRGPHVLVVDNQGRLVFGWCRGSNILLGSPLFIDYWQTDKHSVTGIYGQLVNAICQTQWEDIRGAQNWESRAPFLPLRLMQKGRQTLTWMLQIDSRWKGLAFSVTLLQRFGFTFFFFCFSIINLVVWFAVALMFVQMSTNKPSCNLGNKCSAPIERSSSRDWAWIDWALKAYHAPCGPFSSPINCKPFKTYRAKANQGLF